MARCVEDAGLLLGVLAGQTYEQPHGTCLKGVCIDISRKIVDDENSEWIDANEKLIGIMRELGAGCVGISPHRIDTGFIFSIMRHEFKIGINEYLQALQNPAIPQSLQGIIEYNEQHPDIALKYGQDILIRDNTSAGTSEPEYLEALKARDAAICKLDKLFDDSCIDVLFMFSSDMNLAVSTGFPSMTIPLGKTSKGLPIGSFFVARRHREDMLLKTTYAIQNAISR